MRTLIRLLVVAGLLVPLSLLGMRSASACSCLVPDANLLFESADGAFVGTLIDKPDQSLFTDSASMGQYTFDVVAAHKGEITQPMVVFSAVSGASCGIELNAGASAALFIYQDGDRWLGDLCATMGPEALAGFPEVEVEVSDTGEDAAIAARWALGGVVVASAGAIAFMRFRKSKEATEPPTMPAA